MNPGAVVKDKDTGELCVVHMARKQPTPGNPDWRLSCVRFSGGMVIVRNPEKLADNLVDFIKYHLEDKMETVVEEVEQDLDKL